MRRRSEELTHFFLKLHDLVEGDLRIMNNEKVTTFAVFVKAVKGSPFVIGAGLDEDFLSLKHEGEDVPGVMGVILILHHETAKERLRVIVYALFRLFHGRGGAVDRFPVGVGIQGLTEFFPSGSAEVLPEVARGFWVWEERSVDGLSVREGGAGVVAGPGTAFQAPRFFHDLKGEKAAESLVDGAAHKTTLDENESD